VFPAGAGMNREFAVLVLTPASVPRRRGDEPEEWLCREFVAECSPQARG